MSTMDIPREVTVAALNEDAKSYAFEAETILKSILHAARARASAGWVGEPSTITIVPSSEVLLHLPADLLLTLARIGRSAGVRLRLLDVLPLITWTGFDEPVPSLAAAGQSTALRKFLADPEVDWVSYHVLTPSEMVMMAEASI